MNRRTFCSASMKLIIGGVAIPLVEPYSMKHLPPVYASILRSIYPVIKQFIQNIIIKGIEEYSIDKLKNWIDDSLGIGEENHKELEKIPINIRNTYLTVNGGDIEVHIGKDKQNHPTISAFPLLGNDIENNIAKLLRNSYVPIFRNNIYLDSPNFPELVALNELSIYYSRNLNLGKKANLYLREALLPFSYNTRTFFHISSDNGTIGSSVFKTAKGDIHIIYEISKDLKVDGEITYCPNNSYDKVSFKKREFYHDFTKVN